MALFNSLPDEVIIQILSYLPVSDIIRLQAVSRRFVRLSRDAPIWKVECFNASRAGSEQRWQQQQHPDRQQRPLASLRAAMAAFPAPNATTSDQTGILQVQEQHRRALTNWDPGYPTERLNYYEEYIHRHATINVGWLDLPGSRSECGDATRREAVGAGALYGEDGLLQNVVTPLDDGSVCIWDMSPHTTLVHTTKGKLLARSRAGLLSGLSPDAVDGSRMRMTETGAVECVSIDRHRNKAYFAVQNLLHEVDLQTLQLNSTQEYPWTITALSKSDSQLPLAVGTSWNVHLYDARDRLIPVSTTASEGELIGGSARSHARLVQPGPLAMIYEHGMQISSSSLWVAGRFTSLLNYDVRNFPRLRGTVHSGARIASLASVPFPYVPPSFDLIREPQVSISALNDARQLTGTTMLAAAEYKGKGSLELYGLPGAGEFYRNRQTISSSKLLSVAPHGSRIVVSDGNGNLKWMERDGVSWVRSFNINDAILQPGENNADSNQRTVSSEAEWHAASTTSRLTGETDDDIVQKLIPTSISSSVTSGVVGTSRNDINQSDLILWTGDGRIGLLGFGRTGSNPLQYDQDEEEDKDVWHDAPERIEQRAREDAARQYDRAMRRALERNADEVRFVRGLGMGY